ncbi:thiol disulfide reductase thioredoxin [Micractinium conductrix]|uniref:Thiol disulfide reductase thioredoxin n=1 Tax=Micractinium conductrix TaxID=554055 RepID=A0A2P6VC85_9CHLO|nr:thiol disulfide reductase thioredoxin [Micractinium conductrix]|eukprot:PSC71710.1 thiol disulfide reductase thioredoxin [Micractinium conductrix]
MRFPSPSIEAEFAQRLAQRRRGRHRCSRTATALKLVVVLAASLDAPQPAAAALLLALVAVWVAWMPSCPPKRLLYPLELAIDVLQPAFTCSLVHCLYPPAAAAGALRAFATILLGNGVLALAVRSQTSPLPFRWQLPAILATAATLLAHTRTFCGSALLQHGVATLHALLHLLLPIIAPAFIELAPPEGFGVLWARGHDASAGGAALCAAYHVPSVVLGCAALAAHLYAAEAQQRKAFMAESGTAADGRARA